MQFEMITMPPKVKEHDILGPSNMGKWARCPGSPYMEMAAGPQPPNRYSAEGTVAHALLAAELDPTTFDAEIFPAINWNVRGAVSLSDWLGVKATADGFNFTVDQEMLDATQMALDFVNTIMYPEGRVALPCEYLLVEQKLNLPGLDLDGLPRRGRIDIAIHVPYQALYVIDFKYGKGVDVNVVENEQLLNYAVGVWDSLSEIVRDEIPVVHLVVIQPRRPYGDPIQSYTVDSSRLDTFRVELMAAIHAVKPDAPLVPGDHCQKYFCAAKTTCPALRQEVIAATTDFVTTHHTQAKLALPDVKQLTPHQKANILNAEDMVLGFFKSIKDEAINDIETGKHIPEYKVVDALGNLTVTDKDGLLAAVNAESPDLGEGLYKPAEFKTATQIKDYLKKKKSKVDISPYTARPINGRKLVRDTDPAAATVPAVEAFEVGHLI